MAENPIRKEDIMDFDSIQKSMNELIATLEKLSKVLHQDLKVAADAVEKSLQGVNAATKEGQVTIKSASTAAEQLVQENKVLIAQDNQIAQTKVKLKNATSEETKELIRLKLELSKTTQAMKDQIKVEDSAAGSVNKLRARLKELTLAYNKMGPEAAKKAAAEINKLSTQLKKQEAAIGNTTRNVGNYSSALKGAGKALLAAAGLIGGATMVLRGLFNVIKNGFKTTWAFETAMANVKAVSRATKEEFNALRTSAISLGGSTKFTATEVAGLQKEYAKLGFTVTEILRITSATLDLAAATGSDLVTSATIAGATLRQFQLDGTEMARVVDVMALSFSMSALDMNKFETAMSNAGPVAKAVGETIESTSAKLSVLANSGLDASKSGTSLRNIFLELEKRGLTWNQAMTMIQGSQTKASTSLQLFGKRGAVAGLILAENAIQIDELTEAYGNAAGSAKEMAGVMLENVEGSITILKSGWEGLILRTNNSSGALKGFIDGLALMVTTINTKGKPALDRLFDHREITRFGEKWKFVRDQGVGFWNTLTSSLFRSKETIQEWSDAMAEAGDAAFAEEKRLEDIRLAAEAEEKRLEDERLARLQAEVDAAEKLKEAQTERIKIATAFREKREKEWWKTQTESAKKFKDFEIAKTETALNEEGKRVTIHEEAIDDINRIDATRLVTMQQQYVDEEALALAHAEAIKLSLEDILDDYGEMIAEGLGALGGAISAFASLTEAAKQRELSAVGDNAAAREAIEKKYAKKQQQLAIGQAVVNAAVAITEILRKWIAINPVFAAILIAISTAKMAGEIALIKSQKFAHGGSGLLDKQGVLKGNLHSGGGVNLGAIGEAERGEYFGIINRRATSRYGADNLAGVFDSINSGQFHNVWSNLNTQMSKGDPYTKKMYELMLSTPSIFSHDGKIIRQYPGRTRMN